MPSAARIAAAVVGVLLIAVPVRGEVPLLERDPFDRITLDEKNDGAVVEVLPLDLPGRELPKAPKPDEKIVVHLLDDPDTAHPVRWGAIVKVELFEQLLLAKAEELVRAGRFNDAYDYFELLRRKYPKTPGLEAAIEDSLYEEAKALHVAQHYDGALALLRELHDRNPQRPEVEKALGVTTDKLVDKYVASDNYQAARELLRNLAAWYPQHDVVARWEGQFRQDATRLESEARGALQSGDLRKADQAARQMARVWPDLPAAAELLATVRRKYPRVVVGVAAPAAVLEPGRLDDWAARRASRLVYRMLTEFLGPGRDGGRYRSPVGTLQVVDLGRRLAFQLRPGVGWAAGDATLTGYDLSRQLLAMADPRDPAYRAEWAGLLAGVAVRDVYDVDAELARTHVRPEALLQTVLRPGASPGAAGEAAPANGPYTVFSQSGEEVCFGANPRYFAAGPGQPKEIVERTCPTGAEAIRDLKHGRLDAIDRVNPWELARLRADARLVVEPYAVPLVHVLVPNLRKPLLAQRRFRRALVYAIHREAILKYLSGGGDLPGCQVLSGPFPAGTDYDDPLGYACDRTLKPRPYDPRLALALARVTLEQVAAAEEKQGRELNGMPQLVLAHPADDIARAACQAIQRQLKVVGIPVVLAERAPDKLAADPAGWDLAYAELAMWEPAVDAGRLLGPGGPAGGCSPYMGLVLAALRRAADWNEVHKVLLQVHHVAYDDVAVVPLWQMVDHFAYRKGLRGVGARPVLLYENVEQWQITPPGLEGKP